MAKKKIPKAKATTMKPLLSYTPDTIHVRRWSEDTPNSADYFYDEPIKDVNKKPTEFPPEGVELSDAWVVITMLHMTREQRGKSYPDVFTLRGMLRDNYIHKGQPAKMFDTEVSLYKYCLVDGIHIMHGTEGELEDLTAKKRERDKTVGLVSYATTAQIQSNDYTPVEAIPSEAEDITAEETPKPTPAKAKKTSKEAPEKRVTRQSDKKAKKQAHIDDNEDDDNDDDASVVEVQEDDKKDEAAEGDDEHEEAPKPKILQRFRAQKPEWSKAEEIAKANTPIFRTSKRKAEEVTSMPPTKVAKSSKKTSSTEIALPKEQSAVPVTPQKGTPSAIKGQAKVTSSPMIDDWMGKPTKTNVEAPDLLAMLAKPQNDNEVERLKQTNRDLHEGNKALRKENRALQKQANELQQTIDEWVEKYQITQPMMAFLVLFLRASQASLHTIIKTLTEYDLSNDNRQFLIATIDGNKELNAAMKSKMPVLYAHMYGDTDEDFNSWYESVRGMTTKELQIAAAEQKADDSPAVNPPTTVANTSAVDPTTVTIDTGAAAPTDLAGQPIQEDFDPFGAASNYTRNFPPSLGLNARSTDPALPTVQEVMAAAQTGNDVNFAEYLQPDIGSQLRLEAQKEFDDMDKAAMGGRLEGNEGGNDDVDQKKDPWDGGSPAGSID